MAVYAFLPGPGQWDDASWIASVLGNVSDGSWVARLDLRHSVLTHLAVNAFANVHLGDEGELRFALDVPPNPALPDGLSVPAPLVDLGVGVSLSF